jgi:hypothetical protein
LRPSPGQAEASTRAFFARLAALGLTGVADAGGMGMRPDKYRAIRSVWAAGDLPIRVRMNLGATTRGRELAEIAAWQEFLGPGFGDDLLAVLGLGEVIHLGCHDWEGMVPFDGGLRWSLCHAECISLADLRRVRRLGLGLAVQGRLGHKAGVCAAQWGEDAVRNVPPLGEIARLGIPFGAGTDSTRGASYNPWRALWWFVSGRSQDGGPRRAPGHRLDRAIFRSSPPTSPWSPDGSCTPRTLSLLFPPNGTHPGLHLYPPGPVAPRLLPAGTAASRTRRSASGRRTCAGRRRTCRCRRWAGRPMCNGR